MKRDRSFQIRVFEDERDRYKARAGELGEDLSTYVRRLIDEDIASIEGPEPEPAIATCTHSEIKDLSNGREMLNVGQCAGCGAFVKINPDLPMVMNRGQRLIDPVSPTVAAEIEEAKLADDPAREAFIERRTRELHAQGRTTILARREAEAEWKTRAQ